MNSLSSSASPLRSPATPNAISASDPNPDPQHEAETLSDIFGPPSPISPTTTSSSSLQTHPQAQPQTWQSEPSDTARLRAIHCTAGYRDGIAAAREAAVQGGFDEGFMLGAAVGLRVGVLTGLVEGILDSGSASGPATVSASESASAMVGAGIDGADGDGGKGEVWLPRIRALQGAMRADLRLENVLGPRFMLEDGSWGWEVGEEVLERDGLLAVAKAHPLIRRYAGVVGEWVRVLDLKGLDDDRVDEIDREKDGMKRAVVDI